MYMYKHHVQYVTMYLYMEASCTIWNHVHVHASIMYNNVHASIMYNMEPCTCTCKHHVQYGTMYMYHTMMPDPGAVLV